MATAPLTGRFTAWTDLLSAVEKNDGVYRVPMEALRQLEGAQRLGANVLASIKDRLSTLGFGSLPEELPNRQTEFIVIYRVGTPASDTVEAIKNGLSGGSSGETVLKALWQLNATPSPQEVVKVEQVQNVLGTVQEQIESLIQVLPEETPKQAPKAADSAPLPEPVMASQLPSGEAEKDAIPSGFSS